VADRVAESHLRFQGDAVYFFGRKFGQMKTKKTRHDANSKKISTATRTDKNCT
jgi:hypothetical protein